VSQDHSVSVLTLYELRYRSEKVKNRKSAVLILKQITEQVDVLPLDDLIALLAGTIKIHKIQ